MEPPNNKDRFEIIFARDKKLLDEVKYLRGRVFFGKNEKEEDEFDAYSHHLAVMDNEENKIIGSYRLLLGSDAKKHHGFYSETEFDLTNIKNNCHGQVLEMSRACVLSDYRKFPILKFMWKQIISFMLDNEVKYIFGCPSIENADADYVGKIVSYFKAGYFSGESFRAYPLKEKICKYNLCRDNLDIKEILSCLPSLIKGYLKMGAVICSEPAFDSYFKTVDFFMMLDVAKMNIPYRKKFNDKNT
ncbi:MAG: GNAT family N-acetyltransferase [Candidatus Omnitrophica bacterium]|nr:GNAT family N-acetyltransferase [Candidatus Omnitrophota bacterium]